MAVSTPSPKAEAIVDALETAQSIHLHRWVFKARTSSGGLYQCSCGHTRDIEYGDTS